MLGITLSSRVLVAARHWQVCEGKYLNYVSVETLSSSCTAFQIPCEDAC